ncbi:serine O-acetyltransferase [Hymenobacter sp. BT770]|uniref:serine O-acetyltransferase n=1 Tax=Hymenobacter sp. BT770 TaxID=2886942 RepID=UPI001D0FFCAC|nr:serine O-acetyltransferase [Hymenobacter sp. BT770]MCC3153829.1 serine O-acetyltransferase [Hymenobacter sp. BT770]MDO3415973.1 serine O-acetyltransferase [Hymenobacter sp. BT770]
MLPRSFSAELAKAHASVPDALPGAAFCALADGLLALLFPQRADQPLPSADAVDAELYHFRSELAVLLAKVPSLPAPASELADEFTAQLPALRTALLRDASAILASDPAARGLAEIISSYPGFYATALHRLAHALHQRGLPRLPRLLSEYAHQRTGIDIHPGAHIGQSFCIDHGTGLVIGETAIIGANVQIYQGVTLGALSVTKGLQGTKRHPTIEDHVVIYAGATILGGSTVVGAHSIIGGNVWLTESVPSHSRVYHRAHIQISRSEDPAAELVFSI